MDDELQAKVLNLSNEILSATTALQDSQEQLRAAKKARVVVSGELEESRREITSLKSENAALAQRVREMEDELTDLSSSLVDEANQQVSDANKRAAGAYRLVSERDDVIASQSAELTALKALLEELRENEDSLQMPRQRMESSASPASGSLPGNNSTPTGTPALLSSNFSSPRLPSTGAGSNSLRRVAPDVQGEITQALILDLDAYASPTRPLIRTDIADFRDFCDAWGCDPDEAGSRSGGLFHLQAEKWRRSPYVQRVIKEDIETTLRIDKTPHLSYLTMRSFLHAVLDLTISLDPVSQKELPWSRRPSQPCLLCGEGRTDDKYERSYWARIPKESEPIVMDLACVAKTRLACELAGFLRHIAKRDPTASNAAKELAWRQCNSMREQLFWARTGGLFPDSEELLAAVQNAAVDDFDFDQKHPSSVKSSQNSRQGSQVSLGLKSSVNSDSVKEPTREKVSSGVAMKYETNVVPVTEPVPASVPASVPVSASEPVSEPVSEPASDPVPAPESGPDSGQGVGPDPAAESDDDFQEASEIPEVPKSPALPGSWPTN